MRSWLLVTLLSAGFLAGAIYLFDLHFAAGDVYPAYSSMRADPEGAKILYESLAGLPQLTVTRSLTPLSVLNTSGATILLLNASPTSENIQLIEQLARKGNRMVVALDPDYDPPSEVRKDLKQHWDVQLDRKRGVVERTFGSGKLVLFSRSTDFANFAIAADVNLDRVIDSIGPNSRIIFDESHFGIQESGSIVGLARRFHLTGFAIGLAICTALFLWRSAAAFPPPSTAVADTYLVGRTSHAGLLTLLRRHIPASQLAAACWREWLTVNRRNLPADRIAKAAALIESPGEPLDAVRQTYGVLKGSS